MKREGRIKKLVDPTCLYPLVSIESISPEILKQTVEAMKCDQINATVEVMEYAGYFFILEGNYIVLAANILHKEKIEVEYVERADVSFWNKEECFKEQLTSIGMNALYDFEALGGFRYAEYPDLYKGGN